MICSTIIPTIGRLTLGRAILSVLEQDFPDGDHEVVVVNDSGSTLLHESWMSDPRVQVLRTNRRERSVARNTGAAIARGKYLHFLDDDDWMLPGAFASLWEVARESQAAWIYGGFNLVDNQGKLIMEFHPREPDNCFVQMMASEWIPLQASWIDSRVFFQVGGFSPLHMLCGGYEDIDLSRLVARLYSFAGSNETVANIRAGNMNSTTNYEDLIVQNRQSREKNLNFPGTFSRLRQSANTAAGQSSYWHGKIVYFYLASVLWHLRQKNIPGVASRAFQALLMALLSARYWYSLHFWRGASRPHFNLVRSSLGHAGNELYRNVVWRR